MRLKTRLPLVLVVVSLALLAILPFPVQWRINRLNAEIATVAEPARHSVTQVQGALALEAAGARGFLLTGDEQFVTRHREAKAERDAALSRLMPLVRRLGGPAPSEVAGLMRDIHPADALLDSLFQGRISRRDYIAHLDAQQARLEAAVNGTIRVDEVLR